MIHANIGLGLRVSDLLFLLLFFLLLLSLPSSLSLALPRFLSSTLLPFFLFGCPDVGKREPSVFGVYGGT